MSVFEKLKKINLLLGVLLSISIIACTDNFDDTLENENEIANLENLPDIPGNILDDSWKQLDPVATNRSGAAVTEYNGWIYIYGGEEYEGIKRDFWRYQILTGQYELLTSDIVKSHATLAAIDNKIYLFGGKTIANTPTNQLKYYDLSDHTWYEITLPDTVGTWPDVRLSHVMFAYHDSSDGSNYLIIHGGKNNNPGEINGKIYFLNLSATPQMIWSESADFFTRTGHAATLVDKKIYFFGGYDENSLSYYNDISSYNIETDEYLIINNTSPVPVRSNMKMVNINNNLLIYAGKNDTILMNDCWKYSIFDNNFKEISFGPSKLADYSVVSYENKMYLLGGYYLNSNMQKIYKSDLWEYDFTKDELY